jgi:hypothetical protein
VSKSFSATASTVKQRYIIFISFHSDFIMEVQNIVMYMCDYRRGFSLVTGFSDHFTTRLGTTSNYSAIAPVGSVFTSRFLIMAPNSEESSASALPFLAGYRLTTELDQSQGYFTTGGLLPISSSWRQAP